MGNEADAFLVAGIEAMRADSGADIELRQAKYLNNIVEQDDRAI